MPFSPPILSSLTEDLLLRINSKLVDNSDCKAWRLVCKDFHRVESLNRKTLKVLRLEYLLKLLQLYTNIDGLDLSVCPRVDDKSIELLLGREDFLRWARKLKSLSLSRATGLSFLGVEMLVKACTSLEVIDLSYCCGFGDREMAAVSFGENLKEVRIDKCLRVSDVGLAKVVVGCEKLETLSLKWCMEITDLGIHLLCKKCLELKFLDLSYLKVTNDSLKAIASLQKLEVLAMVGCSLVNDVGLQFLGNGCPLLQQIDVSRCDCVSSAGLISVVRGHAGLKRINAGHCFSELSPALLHCMKDLKVLNTFIIDGARISDSVFHTISGSCISLVEIGLSKCIDVTNRCILHLVSGFVNLKIINLACCHSITDAAVSAIANSCANLLCLKLESCYMITEKSLQQLGSHSFLLEELDLTDCCGINDGGLEWLSRCSRLKCLKLGLCTNISDKGLLYIAQNCSMLFELDLYRCTSIGDDSLAALSSGCKKLKKLNLSYCSKLTDIGLRCLGYLEELSDLELREAEKITSVGLTALAVRCRSLTDLDLKHCDKIDDSGFMALAYYSQNLRQINLSYCAISDTALCMLMGNLTRLQDAKLVDLPNVTVDGLELALRACCARIKKVKLVASLSRLLSPEILEILHTRGCKIRWD